MFSMRKINAKIITTIVEVLVNYNNINAYKFQLNLTKTEIEINILL